MARRARTYTRDNRGRFASSPGGGPKAKPKPRTTFRQRQSVGLARSRGQTGRLGSATKAAKARLKATKARTGAGASPQQKAALTRAKRMASMLAGERRVKTAGKAGVIKGRVRRDPGVGVKLAKRSGKPSQPSRPDTAQANIPMRGARGRQLDASITRAVKEVRAAERARWMKPKEQVRAEAAARKAAKEASKKAGGTGSSARKKTKISQALRIAAGEVSTKNEQVKRAEKRLTTLYARRMNSSSAKRLKAAETKQKAMLFYNEKGRSWRERKPKVSARPTSKVVPRSERRRVTGPRKAGVIAKPKGLKPGVLTDRRAKRYPRSMRGRNVDKNAAYMAFMDRAQALPTKRKNRNDYNQKRATASRGTSVRAQQYIEKWMKPRYYS